MAKFGACMYDHKSIGYIGPTAFFLVVAQFTKAVSNLFDGKTIANLVHRGVVVVHTRGVRVDTGKRGAGFITPWVVIRVTGAGAAIAPIVPWRQQW